jgi:uncharacterized protein (TIGR03086 family)
VNDPALTALLENTCAATQTVVAGVSAEQHSAATPCTKWTVRDLLNHMVAANRLFAARFSGENYDFDAIGIAPELIGDDPLRAYQDASQAALDAWRALESPDAPIHSSGGDAPASRLFLPMLVDNLMHGWDLATATGQEFAPPADGVAAAYERVYGNLPDAARGEGRGFGAEVILPESAPLLDRLLAYTGRTP